MDGCKLTKPILVGFVMIFSGALQAATYECSGKIDEIRSNYSGDVFLVSSDIYGDSVGRSVCNLSSEWNGVATVVCSGWLSKLLAAEARGVDITIQYNDSVGECSDQENWQSASKPWSIW